MHHTYYSITFYQSINFLSQKTSNYSNKVNKNDHEKYVFLSSVKDGSIFAVGSIFFEHWIIGGAMFVVFGE